MPRRERQGPWTRRASAEDTTDRSDGSCSLESREVSGNSRYVRAAVRFGDHRARFNGNARLGPNSRQNELCQPTGKGSEVRQPEPLSGEDSREIELGCLSEPTLLKTIITNSSDQ